MRVQISIDNKNVQIDLSNTIGFILTAKSDNKLSDDMKEEVMKAIKSSNQFSDTTLQELKSLLDKDDYSSFSSLKVTKIPDVYKVALELIEKNGKATDLEIRDELRRQGYWAKLFRVKGLMEDGYGPYNLECEWKGKYHEWTLDKNKKPTKEMLELKNLENKS